ncbi:MAG: 4Fe-4S dicluster domain-containing protein [Defluviitaleaceae bacterium]|nr:4Fe-4S dicluster domain-containing protein [Defluviitaleaceae bacterium]
MNNTAYKLEETKIISGTNIAKCMRCGRCSAACPSYDDMDVRPHQFVSYLSRGDIDGLLESSSLWACLSCFNCVQRCPRGVAPASLIEAVRQSAIRPKGQSHITVEEVAKSFEPDMPQQLLVAAFRKYQ